MSDLTYSSAPRGVGGYGFEEPRLACRNAYLPHTAGRHFRVQSRACSVGSIMGRIDKVRSMIKNCLCFLVIFICFQISTVPIYALTAEEIMRLKEAGVDDKTIQMLIKQEKKNDESANELGTKEIERPDGGKDKLYYSITSTEEERKNREEEKEKLDKAMEILKNIIIDERGRKSLHPAQ